MQTELHKISSSGILQHIVSSKYKHMYITKLRSSWIYL